MEEYSSMFKKNIFVSELYKITATFTWECSLATLERMDHLKCWNLNYSIRSTYVY